MIATHTSISQSPLPSHHLPSWGYLFYSEHGGGELDDPRSNPTGSWPFFQAIIKWPKKPLCCSSTLSLTASASETSGGDRNLHRCHWKNTACTINRREPTIDITAFNNSYRASEQCRRLPTGAIGYNLWDSSPSTAPMGFKIEEKFQLVFQKEPVWTQRFWAPTLNLSIWLTA